MAVVVDPSEEMEGDAYVNFLRKNDLKLTYIIDTHTHVDHISSSKELREATGAKIAMSELSVTPRRDMALKGGSVLELGAFRLTCIAAPGHAPDHVVIHIPEVRLLFTGDTLLIGGTGRADFPHSNPTQLYESLQKLLALPDETRVYPGHDYEGRSYTTIGEERKDSERLQLSRDGFVRVIGEHRPELPDLYETALAANQA